MIQGRPDNGPISGISASISMLILSSLPLRAISEDSGELEENYLLSLGYWILLEGKICIVPNTTRKST